jgi:Domain of unknown function (DUF4041)/Meiotically up-regulated gene 113
MAINSANFTSVPDHYLVWAFALSALLLLTVVALSVKLRRSRGEIANLTSFRKAITEKIEGLEQEVTDRTRRETELRATATTLNDQTQKLNAEYEALAGRLTDAKAKLQELEEGRETVNRLRIKYGEIEALDELRERIEGEIAQAKTNKSALEYEYGIGKQVYDQLLKEKSSVEEALEIYSYGLYKPHYSFESPESFAQEIEKVRAQCRELIQTGAAAICTTEWQVNGSVVEGRRQTRHYQKIMLRAFNGECDAAILKIRWNNVLSMEERVNKSFEAINKLGVTHQISLSDEYLHLRTSELRLTHELREKQQQQKEESRGAREQIREEIRAQKEIEQARAAAEKEELRYTKALEQARAELQFVQESERANLQSRIREIEIQLRKNVALKERAISMAQITRAGHVYVISNIGSFGEDVFKIGMTRRMDPADRVRELGGASVPFGFDLHAMIYSENAPELENRFHKKFKLQRLNLVNGRKEFFQVTLDDIEAFARGNGSTLEFIKAVEAREYRETKALLDSVSSFEDRRKLLSTLPDNLFESDEDDEPDAQIEVKESDENNDGTALEVG